MLVAVGGALSLATQPGDPGAEGGHPWSSGRSLCSLAEQCLEMSLLLMAPGLLSRLSWLTPHLPSPALWTPSCPPPPPSAFVLPALLALHPEPGTLPVLSLQVSHIPSGSWVTFGSPLQPMVSTLQLHGPGFKADARKGPPLEGSQLRPAQF